MIEEETTLSSEHTHDPDLLTIVTVENAVWSEPTETMIEHGVIGLAGFLRQDGEPGSTSILFYKDGKATQVTNGLRNNNYVITRIGDLRYSGLRHTPVEGSDRQSISFTRLGVGRSVTTE